jgi:hypothetical protein
MEGHAQSAQPGGGPISHGGVFPHRDPTPLRDYLRRKKSKLGPAGATTATAHKLAIIFYTMVKKQVEYDGSLWAARDAPSVRNASNRNSDGRRSNSATNSY